MADPDQEAAEEAGDAAEGAAEAERPDAETSSPAEKANDDLDKTRDALVEAAGVSSGLWITYLGVLLYLTIAVGSVTHRDLFLESPITLPFVSVKLPMAGFFVLGPGLFLIVHAYVLLHFAMLADKIAAFDELLDTPKITPEAQATLRRRLPANVFVQFLAGPPKVRDGVIGLFLWLIALITLVIGPILLLLFFELQFLPYHDETISWWQRIAVGIDLGLLWLFWPRIALRKIDPALKGNMRFRIAHALQSAGTIGIMLLLTLGSLPLLLLIATFPGEHLQQAWDARWGKVPGRAWLVEGDVDPTTKRPVSLFSDRLILPWTSLDNEKKTDEATETVSLRGRDLRYAVLFDTSLKAADLWGAHLEKADLEYASLDGAKLYKAHLQGAELILAHLQGADLSDAELQGADLSNAGLQGAYLTGAELQGADLTDADLTGVDLTKADLTKADLTGAQLKGATLDQVSVQKAKITPDLQGAWVKKSADNGKPPDGFYDDLANIWGEIGCDADGAPYVMSRLIRRIYNLGDKKVAAGVATQFLDKDCQGRQGLSADNLAWLQKIANPGQQP
jgi:Pentapeptide repeats (8 copies)